MQVGHPSLPLSVRLALYQFWVSDQGFCHLSDYHNLLFSRSPAVCSRYWFERARPAPALASETMAQPQGGPALCRIARLLTLN